MSSKKEHHVLKETQEKAFEESKKSLIQIILKTNHHTPNSSLDTSTNLTKNVEALTAATAFHEITPRSTHDIANLTETTRVLFARLVDTAAAVPVTGSRLPYEVFRAEVTGVFGRRSGLGGAVVGGCGVAVAVAAVGVGRVVEVGIEHGGFLSGGMFVCIDR